MSTTETDLQARYEQQVTLCLRLGNWLTGAGAQTLPDEQWNGLFARYQEHLARLRELSNELRPVGLQAVPSDALVAEVLALFAEDA